jgi:hypothetical protein
MIENPFRIEVLRRFRPALERRIEARDPNFYGAIDDAFGRRRAVGRRLFTQSETKF